MLTTGENQVDGVAVTVTRRRAKRIKITVKPDGSVGVTVPYFRATLADADAFLRAKWPWVVATRAKLAARPKPAPSAPVTPDEKRALLALLDELCRHWSARLGEDGVAWKLRLMKTRWGVCNWRTRRLTFNTLLARAPRDLTEYVVVHEFTHFKAPNHGPRFYALMDARLPGWREKRLALRRLAQA